MKQPLAVYLCWHKDASVDAAPLAEKCYRQLCRDPDRPFSRGMQIPVYYRSVPALGRELPLTIRLGDQERTAIFIFATDEMVASDSWNAYINEVFNNISSSPEKHRVYIIALTRNALKLSGRITETNFIRLYEFLPKIRDKVLLVHVAHELCRLLVSSPRFSRKGDQLSDEPIKLFLSHSKKDNKALILATAIKQLIDASPLSRFFDAVDIAPGRNFASEIEGFLGDSTVVCIRTDSYSSRPWCQREVLHAKKCRCPIIIVDVLEDFEDRAFPYLGNVPSVRLSDHDFGNDAALYAVIESALLETLRCHYAHEYLEFLRAQSLIPPDSIILPRPPELIDIRMLSEAYPKGTKITYADPPLMPDELELLKNDNLTFATPLTGGLMTLAVLKVGLSVSEPDALELAAIGMSEHHISSLLNELTRYLLLCRVQLLYGGDLRKNGYTEFLFETARYLKNKYGDSLQRVKNYLAWPIYLALDDTWVAANKDVAEFVKIRPPVDVLQDLDLDKGLPSDTVQNRVTWARCLEEMRNKLVSDSHARVSVGGRCYGYKGKYPGIVEECLIAVETQTPLYILGGFGGASKQVALALQSEEAPALTMECQTSHNLNPGYGDMVSAFNNRIGELKSQRIDYEGGKRKLAGCGIDGLSQLNHLTPDENRCLIETTCAEEAVSLILKGLLSLLLCSGKNSGSGKRMDKA